MFEKEVIEPNMRLQKRKSKVCIAEYIISGFADKIKGTVRGHEPTRRQDIAQLPV